MGDLPPVETPVTCETSERDVYDYSEITAMLNARGFTVSHMTVRRVLADNHQFPKVRFGRQIFVLRGPIDQFLAEAATTDTMLDLATWKPRDSAAPIRTLPDGSGLHAADEDVA